jgi:hypothetical protein
MHNLRLEGSGKLIVKRNGVVRAEKADDNMLLNGFYTKLILQQPHLELKAAAKVGMGYDAGVGSMTALQTGLQPTSGLWPTAFLTPDGVAQLIDGKLVVKGFFNFTFEPGQIVGPLVEYGIDLSGNTRPDMFDVDTRLVIMSGADLPLPMQITAQDQVLISYKITLTIDLVQPSKTISVDYDGTPVQHQVKLNISKVGDIIDYINILGSKPSNVTPKIMVSPETPTDPLVEFNPTEQALVGEAILTKTATGAYVPVTLGDNVTFDAGVNVVTFTDSWYQLVFIPPIMKTAQQNVSFTIGQGIYEIEEPPVVVNQSISKWKLAGSSPYISLVYLIGHDSTPALDNGEMQIALTHSQNSKSPGGTTIPLLETGFFTACNYADDYLEDFSVGFAFASFAGKHASFLEIAAEYDITSYVRYGGGELKLIYLWDNDYESPRAYIVNADGSVGVPYENLNHQKLYRLVGWNREYGGEAFQLEIASFGESQLTEKLPLLKISEFHEGVAPEIGYKTTFGFGTWGLNLTHKTDPAKSLSMEHNFYITGNVSSSGIWKHSQGIGKFIDTRPFDNSNVEVAELNGVQLALGVYLESVSNPTLTTSLSLDKMHVDTIQMLLTEGDDVYLAFGVGGETTEDFDKYDYYIYVGIADSPNLGITLKCVKNTSGELNWHAIYGFGEMVKSPESIDSFTHVQHRAGVCGFKVSEWLADTIGNFTDIPKGFAGKRLIETYDIRIFAKPKVTTTNPMVIATKLKLVGSPYRHNPNGWIFAEEYGLYWFGTDTDVVMNSNDSAEVGVLVFPYDDYSDGTMVPDTSRERATRIGNKYVVPGHRAYIAVAADVFSYSKYPEKNILELCDVFLELTLSDGVVRKSKFIATNNNWYSFVPESSTNPGTYPERDTFYEVPFHDQGANSGYAAGGPVSLLNQMALAETPYRELDSTRTWLDSAFMESGNLPISLTSEVMTLTVKLISKVYDVADVEVTSVIELTA